MKNLCLVVICMLGFACSPEGKSENPEIYRQWSDGKAIVVIINADENSDSEHYADWSHYLNEFAEQAGPEFVFHKLAAQAGGKSWESPVKLEKMNAQPYSILFFKKGEPAYFYQGAIVESQVYRFVRLRYSNDDIPEFLHQFSPEEITVTWDTKAKVFNVSP